MIFRKKKTGTVYLPVILDEPERKPKKPKTPFNWGTAVPWMLTVIALIYSVLSGKNAQKWKHSEFVTTEFKEFNQRPSVIFMTKVLDYKARNFCFPDSPFLLVQQEGVADALTEPDVTSEDVKMRFRDLTDDYLTQLGQFYRYYKSGLMSYDDIDANLHYYLERAYPALSQDLFKVEREKIYDDINKGDTLAVKRLDSLFEVDQRNKLQNSLQKFTNSYKYKDVQALFCLYHFNIRDNDSCRCTEKSRYYQDSIRRKTPWYERLVDY